MDIEEFPHLVQKDLSYHFQEQLVHLYLNITRKTDNLLIQNLASQFRELLLLLKTELGNHRSNYGSDNEFQYNSYIDLAYKLVAHTRDIIGGKGEHELFYMMIYELHRVFPSLSVYLLYNYIGNNIGDSNGRRLGNNIGCWRDMKYLCNYVQSVSIYGDKDSLIDICIGIINHQLKKDIESWRFSVHAGSRKHISNVAKWIPREKRRFQWLFDKLAVHWSNHYGRWKINSVNNTDENYFSALTKCKRQYRKVIARMNKIIDTTEIKQCYQLWEDIDVNHVSKYTIMKQKRLFLSCCSTNNKERTDVRDFFTPFPISNPHSNVAISPINRPTIGDVSLEWCKDTSKKICSQKYIERSEPVRSSCRNNEIIQLPISYFVKEAFQILRSGNANIVWRDILNTNWEKFSRSIGSYSFENTLPMVDISYKMIEKDAESFYTGIGIAILIAQKSSFGKRILALENKPTWVNLQDTDNFLSIVEKFSEVIRSQNNTAFCFERGIDIILNALHETQFFCRKLKLVLFSNSLSGSLDKYYDYTETQFEFLNLYPPKIVFWNLSKTELSEMPSEKVMSNCILLSGFSTCLVKYIATLKKDDSAYDVVERILNGERYNLYSNYLLQLVQNNV